MNFDHYTGRRFVALRKRKTNASPGFSVELEGEVFLRSDSPEIPDSGALKNTSLLSVSTNSDGVSTANFGYSYVDREPMIVAQFPLTPEPEEGASDALPPDPSPERAAEGPEPPLGGSESVEGGTITRGVGQP